MKITSIIIEKDVTLEKEIENNKLGILDIKAVINDNEIINIELQVRNNKDMIERSLFYWSGLYHNTLLKGKDYIENKKIISINILLYDLFEEGPYKEVAKLKREYQNKQLTDKMEIYFIQLPKFLKLKGIQKGKLANWLYFISQEKEGLEQAMKENEKIRKAQKEYEALTGDAYQRRLAELREKAIRDEISGQNNARREGIKEGEEKGEKRGIEKGKKEGIKEGEEKGEKRGILKTIKDMLKSGMDVETVASITKKSEEEIYDIAKQEEKN